MWPVGALLMSAATILPRGSFPDLPKPSIKECSSNHIGVLILVYGTFLNSGVSEDLGC